MSAEDNTFGIGAGLDWKNPDYDEVYRQRARALKVIRQPNFDLSSLREYYRGNPDDYINDWGMTFDPRKAEVKQPMIMPFILFPRQRQLVNFVIDCWEGQEFALIEKTRDVGMTWLAAGLASWFWEFHPGSVVGFGSRKEDLVDKAGDPDCILWKVRSFISWLPPEFKPAKYDEAKHSQHLLIRNPENDAIIKGEAGDNIGRGGRTTIYFKDESAHYERPDIIDAALSQTTNCAIDMSSVNGTGNAFHRKRHSGNIPVFVFDWRDDPRKDDAWYKKQERKLTKSQIAQEVDRDYEAAVNDAFISGETVRQAAKRGAGDIPAVGRLRVGVDVARFGDDATKIFIRRGRVHLKTITLQGKETLSIAARVRKELRAYGEKPEQIAVDVIGVGAGVADVLRGAQFYPDKELANGEVIQTVVDVNSALRMDDGEHFNLRAYTWSQMNEWLKTAAIKNDETFKAELTSLRYDYKAGALIMEDKKQAKKRLGKSPDEADACALTFAYPTKPVKEEPKVPSFIDYEPFDRYTGV